MTKRETKTFANYRVKALQLQKHWTDFYTESTEDTRKAVTKLYAQNKDLLTKFMELTDKDERLKMIEGNPAIMDFVQLSMKLENDTNYYRELFFLFDNKKYAKDLCEIYFTDCDFDHDKEMNDDEYIDYMTWLLGVATDFFGNFRTLKTNSV